MPYKLEDTQFQIIEKAKKHLVLTAGVKLRKTSDDYVLERPFHEPLTIDAAKLLIMHGEVIKYIDTLEVARVRGFKMIQMDVISPQERYGLASLLRQEKGSKVLLVGSMLGELRRQARLFDPIDFRNGSAPTASRGEQPEF